MCKERFHAIPIYQKDAERGILKCLPIYAWKSTSTTMCEIVSNMEA
jgi:hypothetical protein